MLQPYSRCVVVYCTALALMFSGCTLKPDSTPSGTSPSADGSGQKPPDGAPTVTLEQATPTKPATYALPTEVSWSLDGEMIAVNNSLGLRLLNADTLQERCKVSDYRSFVFSPDGAYLATWGGAGGDRALRVYASEDCSLQKEVKDAGTYPGRRNADYSFDGKYFAAALITGGIRIWATSDWSEHQLLPGDSKEGVGQLVFSTFGDYLLVATQQSKQYWWDLRQQAVVYTSSSTGSFYIYRLLYQVMASDAGNTWAVNFSNPSDNSYAHRLDSFMGGQAIFSPGGSVFALAVSAPTNKDPSAVQIRDLSTDEFLYLIGETTTLKTTVDDGLVVTDMSFSPDDSKLAIAYKDQTVRIWDVMRGANQGNLIMQTP